MTDGSQVQVAPSGEYVYPLDPQTFTPRIEDIAHQLAQQCRFAGAPREHYSIAQHCCHVADLCSPPNKRWALLHDAPEYVLLDMPSPLKHHPFFGAAYRAAEKALMERICDVFGLPREQPDEVTGADGRLAVTERRDLMPDDPDWKTRPGWLPLAHMEPLPQRIVPWSPRTAEFNFLSRYNELTEGVAA